MDSDEEAARRVGTTLRNKWTLDRLIGTGGMAAVYVATHKIGRREAIKILHSSVARDPQLRLRFEQEAHAVNHFKHPGAVEVRDIDVAEDGSPFLVMELLEGHPLAELARRPGNVALDDLLRWTDELLDVLAAAHAQGIIHRDIKPDNLFVRSDGRLKVLDFGIARVRAGAESRMHTRAGATLGTAPYMPPEQIRGAEIDPRADVFAVGATMFRLIAKRRVHEASSESATLVKMATQPAPSLASVASDVPRDVALVVDRALMFDREQRYPDALTMQADVRAVREGRPPPHAAGLAPSASAGAPTRAFVSAAAVAPVPSVTAEAPTRVPVAVTSVTAEAPTRGPAPVAVASITADAPTRGPLAMGAPPAGPSPTAGLEPTAWAGAAAAAPGVPTLAASPIALYASAAPAAPAAFMAPTAPTHAVAMATSPLPLAGPAFPRAARPSAVGGVPILLAGLLTSALLITLVLWLALRNNGSTNESIVTQGAAVGAPSPTDPGTSDLYPQHTPPTQPPRAAPPPHGGGPGGPQGPAGPQGPGGPGAAPFPPGPTILAGPAAPPPGPGPGGPPGHAGGGPGKGHGKGH